MGLLRHSLQPNNPTSDFELLEFYGDSVLYERISYFVIQTRRFMSPHLLTLLRGAAVNNKNLARCFDTLGLANLLSQEHQPAVFKEKADIVEAIIGELAEACARPNHSDAGIVAAQAKSVLDELLAYISYSGEEAYFAAMGFPHQFSTAAADTSAPPRKTFPSSAVSKSSPSRQVVGESLGPKSPAAALTVAQLEAALFSSSTSSSSSSSARGKPAKKTGGSGYSVNTTHSAAIISNPPLGDSSTAVWPQFVLLPPSAYAPSATTGSTAAALPPVFPCVSPTSSSATPPPPATCSPAASVEASTSAKMKMKMKVRKHKSNKKTDSDAGIDATMPSAVGRTVSEFWVSRGANTAVASHEASNTGA